MREEALAGHEDLWVTTIPPDQGPEGNLALWREAEEYLGALAQMAQGGNAPGGEGALCALVDAHNRCIEERRRAEDLLRLHERWAERPVGGVQEPEPIVAPRGSKG